MSVHETAARFIQERGEDMTLARIGEGTTISLKGKRFSDGMADAGGTAARQSFKIKIGPAELLASAWANKAPARKDNITVAGRVRTVEDARPVKDGDAVALYVLEVIG